MAFHQFYQKNQLKITKNSAKTFKEWCKNHEKILKLIYPNISVLKQILLNILLNIPQLFHSSS